MALHHNSRTMLATALGHAQQAELYRSMAQFDNAAKYERLSDRALQTAAEMEAKEQS